MANPKKPQPLKVDDRRQDDFEAERKQNAGRLEVEKKRTADFQKQAKEANEKLSARERDGADARLRIDQLVVQLNSANSERDLARQNARQQETTFDEERQRHEDEMRAARAAVDVARERLDAESARMEARAKAIAERAKSEAELARRCEEHEVSLTALRVEHGRLQAEAEAAQRSASESRRVIEEELQRLVKQEKDLGTLQQQLEEKRTRLETEDKYVAEKKAQLETLQVRCTDRESKLSDVTRQAQAEVRRADESRMDREHREEDLRTREQGGQLADAALQRREAAVSSAEARQDEERLALARRDGELVGATESLRSERAAFDHERAVWVAGAEARVKQAAADESNARVGAIAESEKRCRELEAHAREGYDAHLRLAQERASDLETAATSRHDEMIGKAIDDDRRRRDSFAKEREEVEAATAVESARRLARANEQAAQIEADAVALRAHAEKQREEADRLLAEVRTKEQAVELDRQETAVLRETLDGRKKRLESHIEEEAEKRSRIVGADLAAEQARSAKLEQMLRDEVQRRTELDALISGSGGETVPRLKQLLKDASGRVAELEQQLRDVPRPEDVQHLREQVEQSETLDRENGNLRLRIAQLERLRLGAESDRVQRDGERAIAETLRATNQAFRQELDHLKTLVDQQVANPLRAFEEVYKHAERPVGQTTMPRSLGDLALRVRHRMAALPDGRARYYEAKVVATAIASLAGTRTILLEGLSGTGKTSLPVAIAEALGATCEVIEVQSQWRDRGDLVGAYNPFHKRFYAQPFALALYKAGLPGFRERPFFIILDELNLSHVEHYFADVLSLMERDRRDHRLRLVDDPEALARAPFTEGLVQDPRFGLSLAIPPNVWFIGTANRDESTRPISDKVYDRALMIELNRRADSFPAEPQFELLDPVGASQLEDLFKNAPVPTVAELKPVMDYLDTVVGELEDRFRITRTNRFDKQWKRFMPVYLAAHPGTASPGGRGKCLAEAMDHFLATKLLRSLKERFDPNLEDMLVELRDKSLPAVWDEAAWGPFKATQSHALLAAQLRNRTGR